jgi:hypothetical protein
LRFLNEIINKTLFQSITSLSCFHNTLFLTHKAILLNAKKSYLNFRKIKNLRKVSTQFIDFFKAMVSMFMSKKRFVIAAREFVRGEKKKCFNEAMQILQGCINARRFFFEEFLCKANLHS